MLDLRNDPVEVPWRPLGAEVLAALAAFAPFWLGLPLTYGLALLLRPLFIGTGLPFAGAAADSQTFSLLGRSLVVAGGAAAVLAIYTAVLFWWTRRATQALFGRAAARKLARWRLAQAVSRAAESLKGHLYPDETLVQAVEIDAPDFARPAHLSSIVMGLAFLTLALFAVSYPSQIRYIPELSVDQVWVAFGVLPALAWWTAGSLTWGSAALVMVLWAGTVLVHQLFAWVTPEVLVFLGSRPAALAPYGGWFLISGVIQLALFLALFYRRRACRVLVLSSRGLRIYELFLWRARAVGSHFKPERWVGVPGPHGEAWRFEVGAETVAEVVPSDPNVGAVFNGLVQHGHTPAFEGTGGLENPVEEIRRAPIKRLLLLGGWCVAVVGLTVPLLHRGLVLYLGPHREAAAGARGPGGFDRLEHAARGSVEALGPNFASYGMLFRALEGQGDFAAADETLAAATRLEPRVWIPGLLLHSPGHSLIADARDRSAQRARFLAPPPRGWEPEDPEALRAYRLGLAAVSGAWPPVLAGDEDRAIREFRAALVRAPRSPAPRVMLALAGYLRPDLLPPRAERLDATVPTGTAMKAVYLSQKRALAKLWDSLGPLDRNVPWSGLRLRGRYPDTLLIHALASLLKSRAFYGEPAGDEARAWKFILRDLEKLRIVPVCGDATRPEAAAAFLEKPPRWLSEAMVAWPGWRSRKRIRPRALGLKSWFQALYIPPEDLEDKLRGLAGAARYLDGPAR